MGTYEAILTYVVVWWLILFMVLPFGAQADPSPQPGHAESAPAKPRLLVKFLVTTLLAALVTWVIFLVIQSGWIALRPPPAG